MSVTALPDILARDLRVVFCGTAVASASAERGYYFAGPRNAFWELLYRAGFTPHQLTPEDDTALPSYGIGITDLVKDAVQSNDRGLDFSRAPDLQLRLAPFEPRWVAFAGLNAGRKAAKVFGWSAPTYGAQDWMIGTAQVFVVPNPSAADAAWPRDGRTKLDWWRELANVTG